MSDLNLNGEHIRNAYKLDVNAQFNLLELHHAAYHMFEQLFSVAIKCCLSFKRSLRN